MNSKKQAPEIWKALSNKIRRDLLCFIGEKMVVSFTEIQERFQMKVGTLYHHLDTLGELITQDSSKKYLLTEKGRRSYSLIEDELDVSAPSLPTYGKVSFLHSVFLRPVFRFIGKDPIRSLGFSLLLFIGLGVATYFLSFTPIFLFPSFISPDYFAPIFFLVSTAVTYLLTELFVSVIYKRKAGKLALLQSTVFAQVPLVLFCLLESLVFDFEYPVSPLQMDVWVIILLMLIQLLFVGLLTESIIVVKELRVEKAGLASLFVVFLLNGLAFLVMNLLEVTI